MLQQVLDCPTAITHRYLNVITLQSKQLDYEGVPEETLVIEVPSNEPLTLQQRRQAYWEKRWSHSVIEHRMIDQTVEPDNWF